MAETIEQPAAIETKIAEYSVTTAALAELRQRFANVAFDLSTTKGDKEARAARLELVRLRTTLEAKRKELKAPALERSRLIDDEAKRITAAIVALEKPIDEQITAAEQKREAERQAKIEAEQRRVTAIRARIDDIRSVAVRAFGKPAAEIEAKIKLLAGMTIGDSYQELKAEAEQAHAEALTGLRELHQAAVDREEQAARLAAERAELDRQRAEQEAETALIDSIRKNAARIEHDSPAYIQKAINAFQTIARDWENDPRPRVAEAIAVARKEMAAQLAAAQERERIAAEQRAAADKLAKEREAFEAQQREQRAAQERIEAQARAEREAADRKAAAERAEADRIARHARLAEEARLDAERAELRRQQDEQRAKEQAEVEARQRAEREAAEAEERRQAEIRAEARRQEELAAIADKRVRDAAPMLLRALRLLAGVVKAMDAEDQDDRPTDGQIDAAIEQAEKVIALATEAPAS